MILTAIGSFRFDTAWGKAVALAAGVVMMFSAWLVAHDAGVASQANDRLECERQKGNGEAP
jgi:hypothetical protein